ncbi:hypothetical protein GCM10009868_35940 [Terrabacter aerolatus]|uniref:DUF5666 domain-containing protein n=1 Tax=Terrabacter aerolatus TaxID=422442 RepID=A0A512CW30_9MICO|nr:hypothetical protein [Terrabacter aerolatus]GEO28422.1 hypothetical protein TAE01_02320 [Terrabacter aerolatus]
MNTDTRRTTGLKRTSTALGGAVLLLGTFALGACSKTDSTGVASSAIGAQSQQAAADTDTVDLVDAALTTPAAATSPGTTAGTAAGQGTKDDRKGLRARMLRALHGTWVTEGKSGPVTHQAIRGEVTAVTATSITVKAKDGFSLTYTVGADTKVRERSQGKGTDSSIGAVKVGAKALVTGVGATNPTARLVVVKVMASQPAASPSPSATS